MKAGDIQAAFRTLPFAPLSDLSPGAALILAPHADDESLGCGGLIAASCAAGQPPVVVIMTDGTGSHPNSQSYPPHRLRIQREQESRNATASLGLPDDHLIFLRLPDTTAPHDGPDFDHAVHHLAKLARATNCRTLFAPWRHDPHCDHEATWKMASSISNRMNIPLLAYPVWGWLIPPDQDLGCDAPDGFRLDITPRQTAKANAIRLYESQYGNLITDDPSGFHLPDTLLSVFDAPFEVFLHP
ncbi:PIG-L deacetylase family protein [Acetobacter fallax]|uniref:PIG-L family deacetylase n=1 Tax=Acetobacter fallax TaxID=1737473 RepID=A0ABX0K531_9PROT|nr:PIG-L deacetylase family protein [Acetobacter fallax]NHO31426.1 PIG-L family deacetylase [Acetobacter fallax]NHO34990.1 PIG-L family deacetylase [Acetobacter fallax]